MQTTPRTSSATALRPGRRPPGRPVIIILVVVASLSLFAAYAGVSLISTQEKSMLLYASSFTSGMSRGDKAIARRYTNFMRDIATAAPTSRDSGKASAQAQIESLYESATHALLPMEYPGHAPDRAKLSIALFQYRSECLAELDRTYARGTALPQAPGTLVIAEERVVAAIDALDGAEKVTELNRQIRQEYLRRKIRVAGAFIAGSVLAAAAAGILSVRRRRVRAALASHPGES
jgi:hypothetical protein